MLIVDIEADPQVEYETKVFKEVGAEYIQIQCGGEEDKIVQVAKDADIILFCETKITAGLLDRLPNVKLMVRYGVGIDNVDLEYAKEKGVLICNAAGYGALDVAEHAFALLIAANHKIAAYDSKIRSGKFGYGAEYDTMRLNGKTLGLVGFGRIARNLLKCSTGFDMNVLIYDPYVSPEEAEKYGVKAVDFDTLLKESDYVSIHSPLNRQTTHWFSDDVFDKMKNTAVLINTARGAIVDQDALVRALKTGKIRAAGIDVYEEYPLDNTHPYVELENIVLTPHCAWLSVESLVALHHEVADEAVRFVKGEMPLNICNR